MVRRALAEIREGSTTAIPEASPEAWRAHVESMLQDEDLQRLSPVINATGVVLHTNLGRAVLSRGARERVDAIASNYSSLEFDLRSGARGARAGQVESLLCRLTGGERAMVVNNAAGALVLALAAVARGGGVVVSRGELVEIGGGFRIPEVVEAAGTRLIEVGTTNRTRIRDFERALSGGGVGALLKVHQSNFRMSGFTEQVGIRDLVDLGARHGVPVVYDLGTGALVDLSIAGLPSEPTVAAGIAEGPALVVFSGDKLLGGPQAGVLVGWAEALEATARHPLARALRADKLTLAGLHETLSAYERGEAWEEIPVLRMLRLEPAALEARARALVGRLGEEGHASEAVPTTSVVGGGTMPGCELASWGIRLEGGRALALRLRNGSDPIVTRIEEDRVVLDLRTVPEALDDRLQGAISAALTDFSTRD